MDQDVLELTRKAVVRATIERLRTTYSDLLVIKDTTGFRIFSNSIYILPRTKKKGTTP